MLHSSHFTDFDIELFQAGKHFRLYKKMGSHLIDLEGNKGTYFSVWAPNAISVFVMGDFNGWSVTSHPMQPRWDTSGIWEVFIPDIGDGTVYKYCINTYNGKELHKSDPFARKFQIPPDTASVVCNTSYKWTDAEWMAKRKKNLGKNLPTSVYEIHLGSWKKLVDEKNRSLSYVEMATELVDYVKNMGFTHVEMMPVMEHPYYASWGYQITGYFAPSSRYGDPNELKYLIDAFHKADIGVILDWVPSHFPTDAHGLGYFDGTHLYEHEDPRKGYHPDWKSSIFNYGRNEVRSFLISNALYWLDEFHADGLRVDAVASMLYLDYSRKDGEWLPNEYGRNENLEAISFLKEFNATVYQEYPDALTIAEESTAFAGVSKPVFDGGLGFGEKWMMGWMHDTLRYMARDTLYRRFHQSEITFSIHYAFSENFMLPLSHDEVVHGKSSLLNKMPGDEWQKFANLRAMFGYMFGHPGTKLLFMGGEFGQSFEWSHDRGLDWWLLKYPLHVGIQSLIRNLNKIYCSYPALYRYPFTPNGFGWVAADDVENSVVSFIRKGDEQDKTVLIVCHFAPKALENYQIGCPIYGEWDEIFNSDDQEYGGSGFVNGKILKSVATPQHGFDQHLNLKLSPLATMYFVCSKELKKPATINKVLPKNKKVSKAK